MPARRMRVNGDNEETAGEILNERERSMSPFPPFIFRGRARG